MPNPVAVPATGPAPQVQVSRYDTVTLVVQSTPENPTYLATILQMLSVQSRRNIVASPRVSGTVSANLRDVTFYEAMEAVLQQNGCGYREKGNVIYVYTLDEIKKIDELEQHMEYRLFRLNYITATDATTFVKPLMSPSGVLAQSGDVSAGFKPNESDGGAKSFAHTDTLIVRDFPDVITEVAKVIKDLDTPPKQVLIEATILEAKLTEDLAFGVDLAMLGNIAVDKFSAGPLSAVPALAKILPAGNVQTTDANAVTSTVGNAAAGPGGLKVGVISNNVAAFVRALDEVTDTTVLANPKLLILNRQRAEVVVGGSVGYLSSTASSTSTTQTVEKLDFGTQLAVRAFIADDGMVRLELKPKISEATTRDVAGTNTVATIPDETKEELTTNVMVRDGQTVVLGGLFKEKTSISRKQVPFLGDVPIAGNAFKGRDDSLERTEVIFLITPRIVKEKSLAAAGAAAQDGIEMLRIGHRQQLLPWSRSKLAASHVQEALSQINKGDRGKAMWEVNSALDLDPGHIEAIRLKEKLTGERAFWPSESLLDESVNVMVEKQTGRKVPLRARPMVPNPRPGEPASDGEPLPLGTVDQGPAHAAASVDQPAEVEQAAANAPAEVVEIPATEPMESALAVEPVKAVAASESIVVGPTIQPAVSQVPTTPPVAAQPAEGSPMFKALVAAIKAGVPATQPAAVQAEAGEQVELNP